jgi:hypothetical protein
MNPGVPCMGSGCHTSSSKTVLTIAGTVYPFIAPHDENNCYGLDPTISLAAIAILDVDTGAELMARVVANVSGNFFTTRPLPPTYKVKVISAGREAIMNAPVSDGNCNFCHTADDFMNAKGRITPQPP